MNRIRRFMAGVFVCALGLGAGTAACAGPTKAPAKGGRMQQRTVRIEETTVGTIDGWRVTVGNIMKGKWRGADGREREGITAQVGLYTEKNEERGEVTVGEGAELTIAGKRWVVNKVQAGPGAENGFIELAAAP
jgi:hypothetical protein